MHTRKYFQSRIVKFGLGKTELGDELFCVKRIFKEKTNREVLNRDLLLTSENVLERY